MIEVTAAIDYRHRSSLFHLENIRIVLESGHDHGGITAEILGLETDLAQGKVAGTPIEIDRMSAELGHSGFERNTGSGGGLLKQHHQRLTPHVRLEIAAVVLDGTSKFEDVADVFIAPEFPVNQMSQCIHVSQYSGTDLTGGAHM